jgi:hypothetical protein
MPARHAVPAVLLALLCLCLLAGAEPTPSDLSSSSSSSSSLSSIAPVPAAHAAAVPLTRLRVDHEGTKTHKRPYGASVRVEFSSELGDFGPFDLQLDSSHLHPSATLDVHGDHGLIDSMAFAHQTYASTPATRGSGDWLTVRCVCVCVCACVCVSMSECFGISNMFPLRHTIHSMLSADTFMATLYLKQPNAFYHLEPAAHVAEYLSLSTADAHKLRARAEHGMAMFEVTQHAQLENSKRRVETSCGAKYPPSHPKATLSADPDDDIIKSNVIHERDTTEAPTREVCVCVGVVCSVYVCIFTLLLLLCLYYIAIRSYCKSSSGLRATSTKTTTHPPC